MKKLGWLSISVLVLLSAYNPSVVLKKEIDDIVSVTGFKQALTTDKKTQFELKASSPSISPQRNIITETGSATVAQVDGEIRLRTTANGADFAALETSTRGIYEAGSEAEAGIGIKIPDQTYTGTQNIKWGYFDSENGFYFGIDSGGVFIEVISGGVSKTKVYQSAWNVDRLDGSKNQFNASDLELDLSNGNIFNIRFIYYGYGTIKFIVPISDARQKSGMKHVTVHRAVIDGGLSTENPNLPLRVEVNNNGSANAIDAFVAGRQFSILGEYNPITRITSQTAGSVSLTNSSWTPIISWRKKSSLLDQSQNVRIAGISAIADQVTIVAFISGGTLTGASFGKPDLVNTASETALESDTSATAITGGEFVGLPVLIQASNRGDGLSSVSDFRYTIPNGSNLTMVARNVTTTGSLVASVFSLREEW